MKKRTIGYILILITLVGFLGLAEQTGAQASPASGYKLLSPLPCELGKDAGCTQEGNEQGPTIKTFDTTGGLSKYLNLMIKILIGMAGVLSVVMIVVGGIEYMTSELVHSKEAGKERIRNALLGLVIALGAYALLYTINPNLLRSDLCIHPQTFVNGKCVNPPPTAPPATTTPPAPGTGSDTIVPLPFSI